MPEPSPRIESSASPRRSRGARVSGIALGVVLVLALGAGVGWAVATAFSPPEEVLDARPFTTVEIVEGEVGSSLALNSVAQWTSQPLGVNQAAGVITSVSLTQGDEVDAGAVLFEVALRPVVIIEGPTPSFRPLGPSTAGPDVEQLQRFLQGAGFLAFEPDGRFGAATAEAVRQWQRSLGLTETGTVETGDVIVVPALPTRITFDAEVVQPGSTLTGGERLISVLPVAPQFSIPVTETQATQIPAGTRVLISSPSGAEWTAFATSQAADEFGTIVVSLEGDDGASICADACGELPVTEQSLLRSQIITVESASGLTVPTAALRATANAGTVVVDEAGGTYPVEVRASARGVAVIESSDPAVGVGLRVRVPAGSE